MGFLNRLLGLPGVEPPKMGVPASEPQFPIAPPYPGAPSYQPPPPPELPLDAELKLLGVPFQQARWRPSDGPVDMSSSGGYEAGVGPVRGMEPLSAPPMSQSPASQYVPRPDPEFAALLSRSQDHLDWYRRTGEQELADIRSQRDRHTGLVGALERRRRGGTGGGGY